MPETYKSFGTIIGSTAGTIIYSGTSGYALVNSINIANGSTALGNAATVEVLKGGVTAYLLINSAVLPVNASLQILDNTLVLQQNDTLRFTAGYTYSVHTMVSVLEIT